MRQDLDMIMNEALIKMLERMDLAGAKAWEVYTAHGRKVPKAMARGRRMILSYGGSRRG